MIKTASKAPEVMLLVERGWRGARELAMSLARQQIVCELVIKGDVPKDVLEIITPRKNIRIVSWSRWYFKPAIIFKIIEGRIFGRLRCVIVNKERTLKWISMLTRRFGFETVLLSERGEDIELADHQQKLLTTKQLSELLLRENRHLL